MSLTDMKLLGKWPLAMEDSSEQNPLAQRTEREDLQPSAIARVWWFHRFVVILTTVTFALAAIVFLGLQERQYTAEVRIQLDELPKRYIKIGKRTATDPRQNPVIGTSLALISSRAFLRDVAIGTELFSDPEFTGDQPRSSSEGISKAARENDVIDALIDRLTVTQRGGSHVISIAVTSRDPRKAAIIVNTAAQLFIAAERENQKQREAKAMTWLSSRIENVQEKLVTIEGQFLEVAGEHAITGLDLDAFVEQTSGTRLAELTAQLAAAKAEGADLRARYHQLSDENIENGAALALSFAKSPALQDLVRLESELQQRRSELNGELGPRHPSMIGLANEIDNTQRLIKNETARLKNRIGSDLSINTARQNKIEQQLSTLKSEVHEQSEGTAEFLVLKQALDTERGLLSDLLLHRQEIEQRQAMKRARAKVISPASIPYRSSHPQFFPIVLIVAMAGFVMALVTIFLRDRWVSDFGFKNMEDLRRSELNPLGYVPELPSHQARGQSVADYAFANPNSAQSESIQRIRSRICTMESLRSHQGAVVLVTSTEPLEGKTTTAVIMARQAAMTGAKTLLIDVDVRNPGVHAALWLSPSAGLCELFQGPVGGDISLSEDPQTPLFILQAGTCDANSPTHVRSPEMGVLLDELRYHYDWIFLDSPSISAVADGLELARHADTTLLLTRWLTTTRGAAQIAIEQLRDVGANLAGVALSRVDMHAGRKYRHLDEIGYYGYYNNRTQVNAQ